MGTTDGKVVGTTKLIDNGDAGLRWNLTILGDGYKDTEQPLYKQNVDAFVAKLKTTAPFDSLWKAINVYRIDVTSTDSGADDPRACGGTGVVAVTYFDAHFCERGIRRLLVVDNSTALSVAMNQVPLFHMAMVLVNTTVYGGSGGAVAVFSQAPDAAEIGLHEMGHTVFGLADEYPYYAGCETGEQGHDRYTGADPSEPNVSATADRALLKWRTLVLPATTLPTMSNADCSHCDGSASSVANGTVGAFEGAQYFHCGLYRAEYNCRMRELGNPYCAACRQRIRETLQRHLP